MDPVRNRASQSHSGAQSIGAISNGVDLAAKHCVPCEVGGLPLERSEAETYLKDISGWQLSDDAKKISKDFAFKDFMGAMAFANKIAALAEEEGHHPDLFISWGKLRVELWTHKVGGLNENDFILAAKIDSSA